MSAYDKGVLIGGGKTEENWLTDPQRLVNHIPRLEAFFQNVEQKRRDYEEFARVSSHGRHIGTTVGGTMKHIASIPTAVLAGLLWKDQGWGYSRKDVYKWLQSDEGSRYRVGRTIRG